MKMLRIITTLAGCFFASYTLAATDVKPVSRTPPAVFKEQLEPLLTPWQDLAKQAVQKVSKGSETDIETRVYEELVWVEAGTGRMTTVRHEVSTALNDRGAKNLGDSEMHFSATTERVHAVLARTTRDGNTFHDVEPEGIFIKRAERSENESVMHTDDELLQVIYPDVAPGTTIENIQVLEELEPGIPGHFMRAASWGFGGGMTHLRRFVVNLPAEMAAALRWKAIGTIMREPNRKELPGGRVLLEWHSADLPPVLFEDRGPSRSQAGPLLRMSTLADWDALGQWFAKEITQDQTLPETIKAEAANLVKGAKTPREKAARLFDYVSRDVRYVALEFGRGNYQPRPPARVASTRYGDCKDKANLLRLLLKLQGIDSRIALIDTYHAGVIDHTIPSPGHFNHAILTLTLPKATEVIFCDPTMDGVPLGLLSSSDLNREALLVAEDGKVEWLRTPNQIFGENDVEVDFNLEPSGGVSGWVQLRGDGALGHVLQRQWEKQTREGRRTLAKNLCAGLENHVVIDIDERKPAKAKDSPFQLRAYVLRTGAAITQAEATERINFPMFGYLLPPAGRVAQRSTAIAGTPMETKIHGGFTLPKGWKVLDLPAPFHADAFGYTADASWKQDGARIRVSCNVTHTRTLIEAREHPALWQIRRDFAEWLNTPALLKRPGIPNPDKEAENPDAPRPWAVPPQSLPKLSTALGQVTLIDKRFPLDPQNPLEGDHASRKIALKQLLKAFPQDPLARFEAGLRLILCDVLLGEDLENLAARIEPLLKDPGEDLTPEQKARGRIMLAGVLLDGKRHKEAEALALACLEDERVPLLLRQFAAGIALLGMEWPQPKRAVEMGRLALSAKALPSISIDPMMSAFLSSLARLPESTPESLRKEWQQLLANHPTEADALREMAAEVPVTLMHHGHLEAAAKLTDAFKETIKEPGWNDGAKESFASTLDSIEQAKAFSPIHDRLRSWLKEHPWPDADKIEKDDNLDDAEACATTIEDLYDKPDILVRYLLRRLTHYGPQDEGSSHLSETARALQDWLADTSAKKTKPPALAEPLLDQLIALWSTVPKDEDAAWDGEFFRGSVIQRRSGNEAALSHYRRLLDRPNLTPAKKVEVHSEMAGLYREAKDYPNLLKEWQTQEQWPEIGQTLTASLHAAHLALHLGDRAAAWKSFEKVAQRTPEQVPDYYLPKASHGEIVKMHVQHGPVEAWWDKSVKWGEEWNAYAEKAGLETLKKGEPAIFLQLDAELLRKNAKRYAKDKNPDLLLDLVHTAVLSARYYPFMGAVAVKLLREEASATCPQHRKAFAKIANQMEAALASQ